jgi:hypothetical protein
VARSRGKWKWGRVEGTSVGRGHVEGTSVGRGHVEGTSGGGGVWRERVEVASKC